MSYPFIAEAEAALLPITELRYLQRELAAALAAADPVSEDARQIAVSLRIVIQTLSARNRLSRVPRV